MKQVLFTVFLFCIMIFTGVVSTISARESAKNDIDLRAGSKSNVLSSVDKSLTVKNSDSINGVIIAAADKPSGTDKKTDTEAKTPASNEKPVNADIEKKKSEKISLTLDYGIQKDRQMAINMIREVNDEALRKELLKKLGNILTNDPDMEIRKSAATALGDHNSTENGGAVIAALDDSNEDVKIAACYAIGKMKLAEAKTKLIELLKKQDLTVGSNFTDAIIIALGDLNSTDIIELAVEGSKNEKNSRMLRERLILYIGKCGSSAQLDFLLQLYKDDEQEMTIRSYSVKSIARLKLKEAAPAIKEVIAEIDSFSFNKKKRFYDLYMQSVTALVELGDSDSIPMLMNSIRSDNADVRYRGITLIKEFDDERTIDILKYKMKYDPSLKVRNAARRALEDKGLIEKESGKKNKTETEENNEDTE